MRTAKTPNLPIEQFPAFREAQAAVGQAQLNLDHTILRAPIAGIATQVDNIQLGRFVTAGSPVLRMTRRYLDRAGDPFEITVSVHPAERFEYAVDLERGHG